MDGNLRRRRLDGGRRGEAQAPGHREVPRNQRSTVWKTHRRSEGGRRGVVAVIPGELEGGGRRLRPAEERRRFLGRVLILANNFTVSSCRRFLSVVLFVVMRTVLAVIMCSKGINGRPLRTARLDH